MSNTKLERYLAVKFVQVMQPKRAFFFSSFQRTHSTILFHLQLTYSKTSTAAASRVVQVSSRTRCLSQKHVCQRPVYPWKQLPPSPCSPVAKLCPYPESAGFRLVLHRLRLSVTKFLARFSLPRSQRRKWLASLCGKQSPASLVFSLGSQVFQTVGQMFF